MIVLKCYDPSTASRLRRQMYALLCQSARSVETKAKFIKSGGSSSTVACDGDFVSRSDHVYNPNYSPARHKSAAERCKKQKRAVPLALQLELGIGENMEKSSFQKAQDARRKPHSIQERGEKWVQNLK